MPAGAHEIAPESVTLNDLAPSSVRHAFPPWFDFVHRLLCPCSCGELRHFRLSMKVPGAGGEFSEFSARNVCTNSSSALPNQRDKSVAVFPRDPRTFDAPVRVVHLRQVLDERCHVSSVRDGQRAHPVPQLFIRQARERRHSFS